MKHACFLWISLSVGIILFNCSSSENLGADDGQVMRLPGMPALESKQSIAEADGLIGVEPVSNYQVYYLLDSIRVVVDDPYTTAELATSPHTLVLYALPNGNSIEWTMGKAKNQKDNWHYNIQYIDAQTQWLRANTAEKFIVAYLEAPQLSWPAWKKSHANYGEMITQLMDSLRGLYPDAHMYLNSHSGGGSLINGFIESRESIPGWVKQIGFIDSNYGYNTEIGAKLNHWLSADKERRLSVFAYNDSIALYEGKPFVSATGGTWFRSKMMLIDLSQEREFFQQTLHGEITEYRSVGDQVLLLLKENPGREIFHTEQVELNGFIHSVLFGTEFENNGYQYFGAHCYDAYISLEAPSF